MVDTCFITEKDFISRKTSKSCLFSPSLVKPKKLRKISNAETCIESINDSLISEISKTPSEKSERKFHTNEGRMYTENKIPNIDEIIVPNFFNDVKNLKKIKRKIKVYNRICFSMNSEEDVTNFLVSKNYYLKSI